MIEILKSIDSYCRENGINYSLDSGTLLGAIRHKGFIPWDDDVDIVMSREDYTKFIYGFNINNKGKNLKCFSQEQCSDYYYPFAKVCDITTFVDERNIFSKDLGVWADIFPIDVVNSKYEKLNNIRINMQTFQWHFAAQSTSDMSNFRKLLCPILNIVGKYIVFPISNCLLKIMIGNETNSPGNCAGCIVWDKGLTFPKNIFDEYIDVLFEGNQFKAIKEYDLYLYGLYGDYMVLPPEKERTPRHTNGCFYRKTSTHIK